MTPADAFVDALATFDDASRFTARFDIFDHYVRDWLRTLSTDQNRLHADFALFSLELTNAFVSSRPGPLVSQWISTVNGSVNGRAFRLYYQLQREERRIRESRLQLSVLLESVLPQCRGAARGAAELQRTANMFQRWAAFARYPGRSSGATESDVRQCVDVHVRRMSTFASYCETAIQENSEARQHLCFFP